MQYFVKSFPQKHDFDFVILSPRFYKESKNEGLNLSICILWVW